MISCDICLSLTLLHLKLFRDCEGKLCTHNTLSVSLSSSLSNPRTTHVHKITCVKMTVVFFWEGDLFSLKWWTTLLPRYSNVHKICQVGTSKLQNAGVRGVSTTVNSKLGQNGPAVSGLQGQTYTQFSCCS